MVASVSQDFEQKFLTTIGVFLTSTKIGSPKSALRALASDSVDAEKELFMKYATVICDSVGELARLFFSFDLKKHSRDMNSIRGLQNYPGSTERLNMFARRQKVHRTEGVEIVFTAHEDIQRIYARGTAMS